MNDIRSDFSMRKDALARDVEPHLGRAGAGDQHRDAHLDRLDDHLGGQPPRRVEELAAAAFTLHPHQPGDRVDGVVAADVLDVVQDLRAVGQHAAVHRAAALVDRVEPAHLVEQREDGRACHRESVVAQRLESVFRCPSDNLEARPKMRDANPVDGQTGYLYSYSLNQLVVIDHKYVGHRENAVNCPGVWQVEAR